MTRTASAPFLRRLLQVALVVLPSLATAQARPADVASPDALVAALYEVISGPAGQKRDWERFLHLFHAEARLIPTGVSRDGKVTHRVISPREYATTIGPRLEAGGFFETELGRRTERFGNVLHAFSSYESKRTAQDPKPFARGINSIQLLHDGARWWVMTVFWDSERADNPIPERYLTREPRGAQ